MVNPPETRCGDFCWMEHASPDPAATSRFYSTLFGWQEAEVPQDPVEGYRILEKDGLWLAGVWPMTPRQLDQAHLGRWIPFVRVEDLRATLQRALKMGARQQGIERVVPDFGRAVVLEDPQGVLIALWQPDPLPAADYVGTEGQPCWFEIATPDGKASRRFFTEVFGWEVVGGEDESQDYGILKNQGIAIGGMQEITEAYGGAPAQCLPYLAVRDCEAMILMAKEEGGHVALVPTELPGIGIHAMLEDPSGAVFGILEPA